MNLTPSPHNFESVLYENTILPSIIKLKKNLGFDDNCWFTKMNNCDSSKWNALVDAATIEYYKLQAGSKKEDVDWPSLLADIEFDKMILQDDYYNSVKSSNKFYESENYSNLINIQNEEKENEYLTAKWNNFCFTPINNGRVLETEKKNQTYFS